MPSLVMRAPAGSLLEQTSRLVVARQIRYASDRGVPWGISESGYNARDLMQAYQYSGFGVPGLGLKRGLGEDLVVAPYATALAAMVDPEAAVRNFGRLAAQGAAGRYGFREALDYTPRRLPAGASRRRGQAATWLTTRGWRSSRSATSSTTGRWSSASTPTRSSRPPSSSSRSACPGTHWSRDPAPKR